MNDAVDLTRAALALFARESGRSVHVSVSVDGVEWSAGIADEASRPAASLLKLPVAMAFEARLETTDQPAARVAELLDDGDDSTVLRLLDPHRTLSPAEVLRLAVGASDGPCARWMWRAVGAPAVQAVLVEAGCRGTHPDAGESGAFTGGVTTARDAVRLLELAADRDRFPLAAAALRSSIRNSRIPLGVVDSDIEIAHKTGTLTGVANDVAMLNCDRGTVRVAFLSEDQHDTLVTGYEMGICTRTLLEAWGLSVRRTTSLN